MARQTTNYGFKISEGNDLVNPLTDIFPNFEDIDTDLKGVSDSAVGTATELLTGTVHALVRSDSDRNVFTFTATSNFKTSETFTLDGVQVTALTPDGQTLSTGCYIIGSEVLVAVKGTLMTVYVNSSKALDSDKLDGHDSTYYATASDVSDLSDNVSALSSKVGIGTLTIGNDCVDGINTLDTHLNTLDTRLNNLLTIHEQTVSVPIAGLSYYEMNFTVDKVQGYRAIGIVGSVISVLGLYLSRLIIDNDTIGRLILQTASGVPSTNNVNVNIQVLYMKN